MIRMKSSSSTSKFRWKQKKTKKKHGIRNTRAVFVKSKFKNYPEHLELKHPQMDEVKRFLSLPVKSKARSDEIAKLQERGAYIMNRGVWRKNEGQLIPKRRVEYRRRNTETKVGDYLGVHFASVPQ